MVRILLERHIRWGEEEGCVYGELETVYGISAVIKTRFYYNTLLKYAHCGFLQCSHFVISLECFGSAGNSKARNDKYVLK